MNLMPEVATFDFIKVIIGNNVSRAHLKIICLKKQANPDSTESWASGGSV